MHSGTATTSALLRDLLLQPANDEAWQELDARCRPVFVSLGRRLGLSSSDAEDAAQEVMMRFIKHYREGDYDRERGKLRVWMASIARRCILDIHRARVARHEQRGQSAMVELPSEDELAVLWDDECRRAVVNRAIAELRSESRLDERTVRAFEMLALEERTVADVALCLGISSDSVYAAKHRCVNRLRDIMARLNEIYEIG